MKSVEKVETLINKAEDRKAKLVGKIEDLKQEVESLYQAQQDDLTSSVLEDKDPSKKITNDLEKARQELREAQEQLGNVDKVVHKELERAKNEIDSERKEFVKDHEKEFYSLFQDLNELKLAYLNKIIEYRNKHSEYDRNYWNTFRQIEERVGLKGHEPRDDYKLNLNQRSQIDDKKYYSPLLFPDEQREAFVSGKLIRITKQNKEAFKK